MHWAWNTYFHTLFRIIGHVAVGQDLRSINLVSLRRDGRAQAVQAADSVGGFGWSEQIHHEGSG